MVEQPGKFTLKDIVFASVILTGTLIKEGLHNLHLIGNRYWHKPAQRALDQARAEALRTNGHPHNSKNLNLP